jgi:hypothetical protein
MADSDSTNSGPGRRGGNRRGGRPGNRMRARPPGDGAVSPLQVDAEANRIVVDFAAARRANRQQAGTGRRTRGRSDRSGAKPAASPAPVEDNFGGDDDDIPVIPLEPNADEYGRDLDRDVYVAAEHGERRSGRKRGGRQRPKRTISNPFGRIEKADRPKGHAPVPAWQKVLMTVCGIAITVIGFIALASGWIQLPGLHHGVLVRTSVEYLESVVRLPHPPQSVVWQVLTDEDQNSYGATKERLIAVLEFTPEQAAALIAGAAPMQQLPDHQEITSERWFPDNIDDLMDDIDRDTTVYDAAAFTTGYFKRGVMVRLDDTGYIVAKLFNY